MLGAAVVVVVLLLVGLEVEVEVELEEGGGGAGFARSSMVFFTLGGKATARNLFGSNQSVRRASISLVTIPNNGLSTSPSRSGVATEITVSTTTILSMVLIDGIALFDVKISFQALLVKFF